MLDTFVAAPLQSTGALAAAAAFPALTWVTLVAWVYLDAVARDGDHPVRSAVTVAVFPPALVAYVVSRPERTTPQADRERLALTVLLALLAAMMVGTVFSPPDVFAQPRNTFGSLLVTLPLFYLLVYRENAEAADADTAS
ncbi:hypothetical protein I7X12_15695 [Halosimplex litoreum]|uniref:Uncharacterized protein n=1 Tax=Halosimplex litoreum TaxID=1198301 RepID=A0A7T3KUE8_9EURY|nr:hypothetical protein [Halosimplex litoreum]QPV62172.1 hypothetical protein I7X12_15695 [Halosimplex litoreum]